MNYKRILTGFFAAAAALCSVGCADDGEVSDFETQLSLSYISYTAPKAGGEQTISIECNDKWAITESSDVDWYSLSATEGSNNSDITIKVEANSTSDSREATFSVASGEVSVSFVLGQAAGDEVLVPTPSEILNIAKTGLTQSIAIENNSVWSAEAVFADGETAWFELSGDYEGVEGDGSFTVTVDPNSMADVREAKITLTGEKGAEVDVVISQSNDDPSLAVTSSLSTANNTMASSDTSFELYIDSNVNWTITDDGDWFAAASTSDTGTQTVTVSVDVNTAVTSRTGKLSVTYDGLETPVEYSFTQSAAVPYFTFDGGSTAAQSVTFAADGTSTDAVVTLLTNDTYTVSATDNDSEWLSWDVSTVGQITLIANYNAGLTELSSVVTLKSTTNSDELTINVSQEANDYVDASFDVDSSAVAFDLFGYSTATTVNLTAEAETVSTITITNDKGTEGWLTLSDGTNTITSGSTVTGSKALTFSASINGAGSFNGASLNTVNTAVEERSATITIVAYGVTKTITVTQDNGDVPTISPQGNSAVPDSTGYAAAGGTFECEFTASSLFYIEKYSGITWYSIAIKDDAYVTKHTDYSYTCYGDTTVEITLAENKHGYKRGGWWNIGASGGDKDGIGGLQSMIMAYSDSAKSATTGYSYGNIYVYQAAADPILAATSPATIDASAQDGTFSVESNVSWSAVSNNDWLTIDSDVERTIELTVNGTLSPGGDYYSGVDYKFSATANNTGAERTGTITLTSSAEVNGKTADPVTVTVVQGSGVILSDAVLTGVVSGANEVTVTADSAFTAGQSFTVGDFALSYTNTYGGASANGDVTISSIALDGDDATKMIITTSDAVYNTDVLTLTSSSSVTTSAGNPIPASAAFGTSYIEYVNCDFESEDSYSGFTVSDTALGTAADTSLYDYQAVESDGNKYMSIDFTDATQGADNKALYIRSNKFEQTEVGVSFTLSYDYCTEGDGVTPSQSVFVAAYADWATVPGNSTWGSGQSKWVDANMTNTTWTNVTQTFTSAQSSIGTKSYDDVLVTYRLLCTKETNAVFYIDNIVFGNAQPRP